MRALTRATPPLAQALLQRIWPSWRMFTVRRSRCVKHGADLANAPCWGQPTLACARSGSGTARPARCCARRLCRCASGDCGAAAKTSRRDAARPARLRPTAVGDGATASSRHCRALLPWPFWCPPSAPQLQASRPPSGRSAIHAIDSVRQRSACSHGTSLRIWESGSLPGRVQRAALDA